MNVIVLLALAIALFLLTYRFYGRFIALGILRIDHDAPTPATHRNDNYQFVASNPWELAMQQLVASSGVLTLLGVSIAAVWGWVPALLWIIVGTSMAAVGYQMGSMWVSLRHSGDSITQVADKLMTKTESTVFRLLCHCLLAGLTGLLLSLFVDLLSSRPESWLMMFVLLPILWLFHSDRLNALPGYPGSLILTGFIVLLMLALSGHLIDYGSFAKLGMVTGPAGLELSPGWLFLMIAALVILFTSRQAANQYSSLIALYGGGLFTICLLIGLVALVVANPDLVAPQFNTEIKLPGSLTSIYLIISAGGWAGYHGLIASGPGVRQLAQQRHAAAITHGVAATDAVFALIVLFIMVTSFPNAATWSATYNSWPIDSALSHWVNIGITQMSVSFNNLGLATGTASGMITAMFCLTIIGAVDRIIRSQITLSRAARAGSRKHCWRYLGIAVVVAIGYQIIGAGLPLWICLNLLGLWLALCVMFLIFEALHKIGRNIGLLWVPAVMLIAILLIANVSLYLRWLPSIGLQWLAITAVINGVGGFCALAAFNSARRRQTQRRKAMPYGQHGL